MTVETRTATGPIELRDDGRTLVGMVMPWDTEARIGNYTETFRRGAFGDVDPAAVPLYAAHHHGDLPIGRALAFADTVTGLEATLRVSETRDGDDVLALVRDGAATGLSVGFVEVLSRWSADRRRVERVRATLVEVSVVGMPAYGSARIAALRHAEGFGRLRIAQRMVF